MSAAEKSEGISTKACPVCGNSEQKKFFEQQEMPIFCNALWPSREKAIGCTRGDMTLTFCGSCGFISNQAFDAKQLEYSPEYENSLHYSARFQEYADSLAERLINDHNLRGRDIVEIGCGKGDFLMMLCRRGGNRGVGFDRSYADREEHKQSDVDIKFVQDFYSEQYASYPADLICCRHVLEHIEQPAVFLRDLRRIVGDRNNTVIYFEVPNSLHTFCNMAVWDIIYEHPNYFVPLSMAAVFKSAGFEVKQVQPEFSNQFLSLTAVPAAVKDNSENPDSSEFKKLEDEITAFSSKYNAKRSEWLNVFDRLSSQKQKAVIWGTGSKGVTFLNTLNIRDQIEYAVDINPRKQGMYVAGTGQKIVAPEILKEHRPDLIIVMNPLYQDEIRKTVSELGLSPEFLLV